MKRSFWVIAIFLLFPSFVFAQLEGNISTYIANKKFDNKTIQNFLRAVDNGDTKTVSSYIEKNKYIVNVSNENGKTALMEAAKIPNVPMMKLLINKGAKVNTTDDEDNSALCYMVRNSGEYYHRLGNFRSKSDQILAAVNLLLSANAKADIYCQDSSLRQKYPIILFLGMAEGLFTYSNETPLFHKIVKPLIDKGATTDFSKIQGYPTPELSIVKGFSPLHFATFRGRHEFTKALLDAGFKVNQLATTNDGHQYSPLDLIFKFDPTKEDMDRIVKTTSYLVDAGAKFHNIKNMNELVRGAFGHFDNYPQVLDLVLTKKLVPGNINTDVHDTPKGQHPLVFATCRKAPQSNLELVKVLVKHGAKVTDKQQIKEMFKCANNIPQSKGVSDYLHQLGYK